MYFSKCFIPIKHQKPSDVKMRSHCLMQQAGLIKQVSSGIYTWLPLGLSLLNKVIEIVKQELNKNGCIELLTPCIQPQSLWQESGRIDSYGKELLKMRDRHNQGMLFAPTAEEIVTKVILDDINSYKDLPKIFYQVQWKFRDEIRPRGGLIRSREMLMKDAYSFDVSDHEATITYWKMCAVYLKIYKKLGLDVVVAEAENGPIGGNLSHEFHVPIKGGHSTIFYQEQLIEKIQEICLDNKNDAKQLSLLYSKTQEKHDVNQDIGINLVKTNSIEVGHIFFFSCKYSNVFKAFFANEEGSRTPMSMSSYGIGISRLVACIIEKYSDSKGMKLPMHLCPFKVSIIVLSMNNQECIQLAKKYYNNLKELKIEVLFDDSCYDAKVKMKNNEILGIPIQIVIGAQVLKDDMVQINYRYEDDSCLVSNNKVMQIVQEKLKNNN